MSKTVIQVEQLSKRYRLGIKEKKSDTLLGQISQAIQSPWQNLKQLRSLNKFEKENESEFWALKDINFEVKEGEILGIIGKNGAGKSTLLKILSQITEPTSGRIELHGRVASLLEVGTGFHPELSGRENIYMNGTILGMTRKEIDLKLEEIIDFSGVEKFIDTPVKHYSSGMKVRLGFSVAAHLEPEILIIDEVLAVGDFEFQRKCLGKMEDVSKNQGRTVLFVSHQIDAITRLCKRAILLENGYIKIDGFPAEAINTYYSKPKKFSSMVDLINTVSLKRDVQLLSVALKNEKEYYLDYANVRDEITVEIKFEVFEENLEISPSINIYNEHDDHLFTSHNIEYMRNPFPMMKGIYLSEVKIPSNFLSEGIVSISIALLSYNPFEIHINEEKILSIHILDKVDGYSARGIYAGHFPGLIRPILKWNLEKI